MYDREKIRELIDRCKADYTLPQAFYTDADVFAFDMAEVFTNSTDTWTRTNLQDRSLAENNQRGVNGFGYAPGPYSRDAEDFVIRFARWYRAQLRMRPPEGSISGC